MKRVCGNGALTANTQERCKQQLNEKNKKS